MSRPKTALAPHRKLSLFDATMLVMGGIIGVGIFLTPQAVALEVPTLGPYLAMWVFGGLAALAGAMTFAELAGTFPRAGGWFIFLREAYGPFPAFLFAWIVLLVVSTGASAVVAEFCARQIAALVFGVGAPEAAIAAIGASTVVVITVLASIGTKTGARFQNACMLAKLAALAVFVVAGLAFAAPATAAPPLEAAPSGDGTSGLAGMFRATLPVLFAFGGVQLVTYVAPSVRDPARNLPRAILVGVAGVVVVYLAANLAFVRVLGMHGLGHTQDFAAEVARRSLGPGGARLLVAAMAVSSLGVLTAILLTTPGIYVAMAREGLFFERFGRLSPRTGAPVAALVVQATLVLLYYSWGRAELLTDAVVFAEWIFHFQVGAALLLLRWRRPELPRPYTSPVFPLFPLLYAGLAAAVVVGSLVTADARTTRLGLGVLLLGALVYRPWRRLVASIG